MNAIQWEHIDGRAFWKLADQLQEQTVGYAKDLFAFVEHADPQTLLRVLVQYRFFTIYYIPDLAILVARMQDSGLRSFLADVLCDELGKGDPLQAHPRLYDDFLHSLDVSNLDLDACALASNIDLLEDARRRLTDPQRSTTYGIGLRGMGGECVCQVYLSRLYEHLIKNPHVRANRATIDWRFWDLHVGEHDIEHGAHTRALIDSEIVARGAAQIAELGRGYYASMRSWSTFWSAIFESAHDRDAPQARVPQQVDFRSLSSVHESSPRILSALPAAEQFHLAIPVRDLEEARRFYVDVMGAKQGRATANFIDFNFYGHHLVLHAAPRDERHNFATFRSAFHGEEVQIPHFGMNLDRRSWSELAQRIKANNYDFFDPPHVRMEGMPGEHATLFVVDPSGNAMEFKAFRNHREVFSRVFDPQTSESAGLQHLAADAAARTNAN